MDSKGVKKGVDGSSPETMVAPGTGGEVRIVREDFEKNPQAYFAQLHENEKGNDASSPATMVAPGTGGEIRIVREDFEKNPQGYFAKLKRLLNYRVSCGLLLHRFKIRLRFRQTG